MSRNLKAIVISVRI